jgi:hypothetical protein
MERGTLKPAGHRERVALRGDSRRGDEFPFDGSRTNKNPRSTFRQAPVRMAFSDFLCPPDGILSCDCHRCSLFKSDL